MVKGESCIGTMHLMYASILLYIISYAIENIKHDIYIYKRTDKWNLHFERDMKS